MAEDLYQRIADTLVGKFDVDRRDLGPDRSYADMGLDSVSIVELFVMIEEWWGLALPEGTPLPELTPARTVALVAEKIRA
ncbi:acyl carrier protein [Hamadaea tsunoensis]|uniref:acyl carrier protein n=1 Tax=Hamadaea tsunoensis TaxID=53368 RepID=UPI0003F7A63E|nr:acyl carrier protein [Hamadaea tsunoensis]